MIKNTGYSLFISILTGFTLSAQIITGIPQTAGAQVDGEISSFEWQTATRNMLIQSNGDTSWILMQHDGQSLFFAFYGQLQSGTVVFPEVLLDVNHSRSTAWEADDWWFHVSATDCESQGVYGNFDSCAIQRPNWQAVPNFTTGQPLTDSVEISIPFNTINYSFTPMDTIGLAFVLSNTVNIFDTWPDAASHLQPSSWSQAILWPWLKMEEIAPLSWGLYPNPSDGPITLTPGTLTGKSELSIWSGTGKLLHELELSLKPGINQPVEVQLPPGFYLVFLRQGDQVSSQKLVIR